MKKLAIVIGRFNPVHSGHYELFKKAEENSDIVLVIIGSTHQAPDPKNPLTFSERSLLIELGLPEQHKKKFHFRSSFDTPYSDFNWLNNINNIINSFKNEVIKDDIEITLYACKKDTSTSKYLDFFTSWKTVYVEPKYGDDFILLSSTYIRTMLFTQGVFALSGSVSSHYNEQQQSYLIDWINSPRFHDLQEEFCYYRDYLKRWNNSPFPPMFITCDSVVLCNHHVLVIRRKNCPGKDLLALPGGFLNIDELIKDGILRELFEETNLQKSVPARLLRDKLKIIKQFDYPTRSLRGRVITNVGLFELTEKELPTLKAADDAKDAFWLPLNRLNKIRHCFFEDHFHIISSFL